jgi:glutamate-1-semialdehyde 2,1-aminomutase
MKGQPTYFLPGVTHDRRYLRPFPIYVNNSLGAKKWDVNGREYIDYSMGHGALILGHRYPDVIQAIHRQIDKGTHYGGCHEMEIEWGEAVYLKSCCKTLWSYLLMT